MNPGCPLHTPSPFTRRGFLATTGAVAASSALAETASPGAGKIRLGLIGCGNRGQWIAKHFSDHGGYVIAAMADYFEDRVNEAGDKFQVPPARRYTGLDGYRKLLESGVDAVAIESPPYFHPEQAAAAVAAGKHVYCAKPVAVDVPGAQSIERSGQQATANRLVFLVDFQTRVTPFYIEALNRIHAGSLGAIAFGEAMYHGDCPWRRQMDGLRANPGDPEARLRAWGLDRVLSGDIVTEQFIHSLDVMNWVMREPPVSATASHGLRVREKLGTCSDHFTGLIRYANGVTFTFSGNQFNGYGSQPTGIRVRAFGQKGVFESAYGGTVMIRGDGDAFYRGGNCPSIFADGAKANIAVFHDSIRAGRFDNPTVKPSVQSNLVTLLVRQAAYSGEQLTWNELVSGGERLEPGLKGLKA